MESVGAFANRRLVRLAVLGLVALALVFNFWQRSGHDLARTSENAVRGNKWVATSDYDLVFAVYSEELEILNHTIVTVKSKLPKWSTKRVIIYYKGDAYSSQELLDKLVVDEVVSLENIGREGETYLNHIIRHYEQPLNLAKHTLFMQPHLAWEWTFLPRLEIMKPRTGFISFGPYRTQQCGHDDQGNDFPRMKYIYESFRDKECPMDRPQLSTWAGQFAVSRKRILENELKKYQDLSYLFHAPPEHEIWQEGWHNNKPSNPTLGHALERTWPVIFNCENATLAETCGEGASPDCQCFDGEPRFGLWPSGE